MSKAVMNQRVLTLVSNLFWDLLHPPSECSSCSLQNLVLVQFLGPMMQLILEGLISTCKLFALQEHVKVVARPACLHTSQKAEFQPAQIKVDLRKEKRAVVKIQENRLESQCFCPCARSWQRDFGLSEFGSGEY